MHRLIYVYLVVNFNEMMLFIPFLPQGTVDNDLEPKSLACSNVLDPNCCRQPSLYNYTTFNLCMLIKNSCFVQWHSTYSYHYYCISDIAAVGTPLNVISYQTVLDENLTHQLFDNEQSTLPYSTNLPEKK